MNLKWHLLYRITVVGLICLLAAVAYLLYNSNHQARQASIYLAESLDKQLESQLLLINAGIGQANTFPDFDLWKQTANMPGLCIAYVPQGSGASRSLCNGAKSAAPDWPKGFEAVYRRIFNPGQEIARPIGLDNRVIGTLTVTPSAETETAQAWDNIRALFGLSAMTILAVCLLVYLSISRALKPAGIIVAGLERMESGDLASRLPGFEVKEWQRTATAINQLAASQQQLLEERRKLVVKLMNLQEEERRYLARELHDEFGQCLTAINAVAASIAHSAKQHCPGLVDEASAIGRIAQHMLDNVRGLLGRLRPAELDELGLAACLNSLVAGWNTHGGGIDYRLRISGDCASLPEPLAVALFRIIQECLTNIAKHSQAANADLALNIGAAEVTLAVKDDGIASRLPFTAGNGVGLIGIRERALALDGKLRLAPVQPHGLSVEVWLPLYPISNSHS